jgi:AcrR family transcriptional regulator
MVELPQLPLGTSHRDRLIAGLAQSIRERGYRATKITDVVALARTSRRSFYEQFDDRDDCFLALVDTLGDVLVTTVSEAVDPSAPWEQQVDQALGAYLDAIAAEPELTISFHREMPALGERGAAAQRAGIESFAELLMRLAGSESMQREGVEPVSRAKAVMLVGGMRELIAHAVESGESLDEVRVAAAEVVKATLAPGRARAGDG